MVNESLLNFCKRQCREICEGGWGVLVAKFHCAITQYLVNRFITSLGRAPKVYFWNKTFGKADTNIPRRKKIFIHTVVYGEHIKLFEHCLLRSLYQPNNIPRVIEEGYVLEHFIYTASGEGSAVRTILEKINDVVEYSIFEFNRNSVHCKAFEKSISYCIDNNRTFIAALPDEFWGNGMLSNLVELNMDRNLCIAVPHLRVDENQFLDFLLNNKYNISHKNLVALALKYGHENIKKNFINLEFGMSKSSGISLQKINETMYALTHRLPNVSLAHFYKEDIKFFKRFGPSAWDHTWPEKLIQRGRYKVCGSSQFAFYVELTKLDTHLPKIGSNYANDDYDGNTHLHKIMNRNFVSILEMD